MMKSAAFQAFLVVLGVVLAFAANEWREAGNRAARVGVALDSIYEEIAANESAIVSAAKYHAERRDIITERLKTAAPLELGDFPMGFIRPALLSDAAWSSARETGVLSDAPFKELLKLSELYDQQERYEHQAAVSGDIIYRKLFEVGYGEFIASPERLLTLINSTEYLEIELAEALAAAKR